MLPSDVGDLLPIFSDPKVMASLGGVIFDRAQMEGWVRRNLEHQEAHGYGLFAVILQENNLLIGDCGLEVMEVDGATVAELGYDFRSDYWNRGYATEAATAVRDFAFQTLGVPQIISLIRVGNVASMRVAEKVGMQCVEEIARYGQCYWKYIITREATQSDGNE
jgi:RimJ/RimL family protein N-acetyltransferase